MYSVTGMGSPQTMEEGVQPSVPRWAALCTYKVRIYMEGGTEGVTEITSPLLTSSFSPFLNLLVLRTPGWPHVPPIFISLPPSHFLYNLSLYSLFPAASFPTGPWIESRHES